MENYLLATGGSTKIGGSSILISRCEDPVKFRIIISRLHASCDFHLTYRKTKIKKARTGIIFLKNQFFLLNCLFLFNCNKKYCNFLFTKFLQQFGSIRKTSNVPNKEIVMNQILISSLLKMLMNPCHLKFDFR